jgi:hypothetical protein
MAEHELEFHAIYESWSVSAALGCAIQSREATMGETSEATAAADENSGQAITPTLGPG